MSVRVLDDVTMRIHAGELWLLQATEALGQSMLLAALAGREHSPSHRYIRSKREPAPGLRIRRAAVHVEAIPHIMRGWQEGDAPGGAPASRTLYLLRATRAGALTRHDASEWRRWGRQTHERGDGVVIACPAMPPTTDRSRRVPPGRATHEPTALYAVDAMRVRSRTIHILELRAGRLHMVQAPRRSSTSAE